MNFCVSLVSHQSWSGGYQRLERWRPTWRKTPRKKLKTSWCRRSDVQCPREKTVQRTRTIKNKENSHVGAEKILTFNMFLRCRVVMATQCCSRTLHWRESNPWPWCWIFSWTALQGKARLESHTTKPWKTDQTQILNTFFYCYVITVSPNVHVHFSLIKLNSSSHLCQNNLSSFSWLTHKMLWMVTCAVWKDISCLVLSEQPGRGASRVEQQCPSGQICAERITRVEAGRHSSHSFT